MCYPDLLLSAAPQTGDLILEMHNSTYYRNLLLAGMVRIATATNLPTQGSLAKWGNAALRKTWSHLG
jgi:hypothetical protein